MATMNMRGLRDTGKLKAMLREGRSIELRNRNRVIGRIIPEKEKGPDAAWPDFEGQLKDIFGDKVLNAVSDFLEDRHRW